MSQAGEIDVVGTHPEIPTEFIADVGTAVPIANQLELLGEVVANGVVPFQSVASGNTVTYQVQLSNEIADTDATKVGLSAFNSASFDVDGNGFVNLLGGGVAATNIDVDAHTAPGTDPVVPNGSGNITLTGAQVASGVVGANVIRSDSTVANTVTIEIQRSTAVAATDSTKNGVAHFNSTQFSVDANGFVALAGGGLAIDSFQPDSGTNPVVPTAAGLVVMAGSGSITTVGSPNTLTTQLTGLTNHAVLVGAGTSTITKLAVGTNGQVLIGATGADPAFATLTSSDSSITFTTGANSLSLQVAGGTTVGKTITGNTGGALSPTGGNWNIVGGTNCSTSGSGSTLTINVTGTGDVVGPGSATDNALVRFDLTTGKLIQNGVTTEDDIGNISQSAAVSGASLSILTANTSNTASATAYHEVQVAGGTASDAYFKADISGGQNWTWGLDNSDSDAFAISSNASLGTTNVMRVATTGEINYPLQTAFAAYLPSTDLNKTGTGGDFAIGSATALTEIYDQNSDFNTNGTFTAPVTGRYCLKCQTWLTGCTANTGNVTKLVTSNRTWNGSVQRGGSAVDSVASCGVIADMDAADTCTFTVAGFGEAGVTDDVLGQSNPTTYFSGFLAC